MTGFYPLILSVYGNGIDLMCTLLSTRPHSGSVNTSRLGGGHPLLPVAEAGLCPQKTVKNHSFFKKITFVEKILDMYLLLDLSSLLVNTASLF